MFDKYSTKWRLSPVSKTLFKLFIIIIDTVCIDILSPCKAACHMCVWYLQRTEEGFKCSGTRAIDGCETLCVLGIKP